MNPQMTSMMNPMNPVELSFDEEASENLVKGIKTLSKAVKSTLGPGGNTVLLESLSHTKGMTITKDGATVAKSIELIHPIQNLACRIIKDASSTTAELAGDGTTTSIVLTEALVLNGIEKLKENPNLNKTELLRQMNIAVKKFVEALSEIKVEITEELLKSVATVSANNDPHIGELISDVYKEVGLNGVVHYAKSKTFDTYTEVIKGLKFDIGFNSEFLINDHETNTYTAEDVLVLVTDVTIHNLLTQMRKDVLENLAKQKVLFVAPMSKNSENQLVSNVMKYGVKWCIIPPPMTGWRQKEILSDLAISIGAKYFSEENGNDLSLVTLSDFGKAKNVIVSKERTVIIPDENNRDNEAVKQRIEQLKASLSSKNKTIERKFISERISALNGAVGFVYAGGQDMEQKELYDRIEDAVSAVRSAIEEGVLVGAGRSYEYVADNIAIVSDSEETKAAYEILCKSIKVPVKQILENAGMKYEDIYTPELIMDSLHGYNVKTREYGNLLEMGVVDPFKVSRIALEKAVSVATTILSTNAVITIARAE